MIGFIQARWKGRDVEQPETDYCPRGEAERHQGVSTFMFPALAAVGSDEPGGGERGRGRRRAGPRLGAVQKRVRHTVKKNKSVQMVKVPVGDAFIEAGRMQGEVRVSVRAVCNALGVNFSSQLAKLKKKPWAGVVLIVIPSPGGPQLTATIPLRALPMWLAGLSAAKVKPALRPRLERFQLEAADALARHFGLGGFQEVAPARRVPRAERRARLVLRLARSLSPASVEQRDALLVAAAEWLLPYRDGCVQEAPRLPPRVLDLGTLLHEVPEPIPPPPPPPDRHDPRSWDDPCVERGLALRDRDQGVQPGRAAGQVRAGRNERADDRSTVPVGHRDVVSLLWQYVERVATLVERTLRSHPNNMVGSFAVRIAMASAVGMTGKVGSGWVDRAPFKAIRAPG